MQKDDKNSDELTEESFDIGLGIRSNFLQTALLLEKAVTDLLSFMLRIDPNSKSMIGSQSITLFQKVRIMIDMGLISKSGQIKFEKFMSIRNQLMHSFEASTYVNCISRIDGCHNWLYKEYGKDLIDLAGAPEEVKLKISVNLLRADVLEMLMKASTEAHEKYEMEANEAEHKKVLQEIANAFIDSVRETAKGVEQLIADALKTSSRIDQSTISDIGNKVVTLFFENAGNQLQWDESFLRQVREQSANAILYDAINQNER